MKRKAPQKKIKNNETPERVDAILTADWHFTDVQPPCRTDEYYDSIMHKIVQVKMLQEKYNCPVLHAGDVFEKARPPLYLVRALMIIIPQQFKTCIGNHDLPMHNMELYNKSGVSLLEKALYLDTQYGNHYGQEEFDHYYLIKNRKILMTHEMVWQGKSPWPGCTDPEIHELFDMYPEADLIVSGHNHKTMMVEQDGRLIVNPGSLTRHKADQINHKPCVFLYDSIKNKAIPHYLNINEGVMSREHIEVQNAKDLRLQKFIDNLKIKNTKDISFESNMEILLNQNKVSPKIDQIIQKWME